MKPDHIFVVGLPRSGTKFLRNVLNAHSEINISPETHFFSHVIHTGVLKRAKQIGALDNDRNLEIFLKALFNQEIWGTFWKRIDALGIDKEILSDRIRTSDRSFKQIFAIILDEHRKRARKKIAGEKTPSHLFHIPKLMEWFPRAKVVHIIRDPRAVLASEIYKKEKPAFPLKKGNPFYAGVLFVLILVEWAYAVRLHERYLKMYPGRYFAIRYEDLLLKHAVTVKRICEFLEITFEPQMLNPPLKDSSFQQGSFVLASSHEKWRKALPKWMARGYSFMLNKHMGVLNYR